MSSRPTRKPRPCLVGCALAGFVLSGAVAHQASAAEPAAEKPQTKLVDGVSDATPPPARPEADKKADKKADQPAETAAKDGDKKPASDGKKPGEGGGIQVERTAGGQKLFRITQGLVIDGQQQKPNAFYVLQRASAPYDWEELSENFLSRIGKAAQKKPF